MNIKFIPLLLYLFFILPSPVMAEKVTRSWTAIASEIEVKLEKAKGEVHSNSKKKAKSIVSDAYFDLFEGSGMETAITLQVSEERTYELEQMFGKIRVVIDRGSYEELSTLITTLTEALQEEAIRMDKTESKPEAFSLLFDSFLIILREGFEAILIISALVAYLVKTGHADKVKRIYTGSALALFASIATAILFNSIIKVSGEAQEAIEGLTMLTATAVLFYVSYWLISKAESSRWQNFIKGKISDSLSSRNVLALSFAAFLAVYREGAETILFYQALLGSADDDGTKHIFYGFSTGIVALFFIYVAFKYTSLKVPLGPFFSITSLLLYYLAFSFAGKGVRELQEATWIASTPINFPTIHALGIFPSLEGLLLQGVLLIAAITAAVIVLLPKNNEQKGPANNV